MANRLHGPGDAPPPRAPSSASPAASACRCSPPTTCSITLPSAGRSRTSLTCIREHRTLTTAGRLLAANAERHLKNAAEMARLFRDYPEAIAETVAVLEQPRLLPRPAQLQLSRRADRRCGDPAGGPDATRPRRAPASAIPTACRRRSAKTIAHELELIDEPRTTPPISSPSTTSSASPAGEGILCQGRGSAANSAVCYLPRHHRGRTPRPPTSSSSASSRPSATSRPTSTSISSMSGARR